MGAARSGAQARQEPAPPGPVDAGLVAELDRLTALGATLSARHDGHVVLLDPEGNEF
ncbi:VOC family protein [Streptomyces sp. QTS52]